MRGWWTLMRSTPEAKLPLIAGRRQPLVRDRRVLTSSPGGKMLKPPGGPYRRACQMPGKVQHPAPLKGGAPMNGHLMAQSPRIELG